ncbi:peptide-methionine (R)-S-oxide reductase MsrB [Hymenobacter terricola]|uniref:peptide-methionine (R)-S-oxide reductase MsrB n=1 Tax=Hymenobacter terricola TaxID=2819236 RepID=UPI001B314B51|nr:peptide-methionine (R)-S-oxide reductase MsrB [Hymenobacter terricola]
MRFSLLFLFVSVLALNAACSQKRDVAANSAHPARTAAGKTYFQPKPLTGKPDEFPVRKTDAEWHKILTPAQYYILREDGTERPFSNKLYNNHVAGSYYCAADHNLLFTSDTKFDSGTGWPSFFAPATDNSVKVDSDTSFGMSRDEIVCAKCGGHLGHVFDDGPAPTHQRYCMDGDALVFENKK